MPVIAVPAMGTRGILAMGLGALVAEDNEADFAARIVQLMTDEALRNRLSFDPPRLVEEWSARKMAQQLGQPYRQIVTGRPERIRCAA